MKYLETRITCLVLQSDQDACKGHVPGPVSRILVRTTVSHTWLVKRNNQKFAY